MNRVRPARVVLALALLAAACDGNPAEPIVEVPAPLRFASVSVAQDGGPVCALSTEGAAYCWGGSNYTGELGTGSTGSTYQSLPVRVTGDLRFRSVSPGNGFTCGATTDGALYCWGAQAFFSGSDTTEVPAPVRVQAPPLAAVESAGWGAGVCGLSLGGAASCTAFSGTFADQAPGYTFSTYSRYLQYVGIGSPSRGGYSRAYYHQCGIRQGTLLCWGDNWYGELGNGTVAPVETSSANPTPRITVPTPVAGSTKFRSVGTGWNHTCAIATDDTAWCWGRGIYGMLGTQDGADRAVPTQVAGGLRLRALSVGNTHACGVATDASAYCWGRNSYGELGNGGVAEVPGSPPHNRVPVRVSGDHRWKEISAGQTSTCGVTEGGDVYCWGWGDSGMLGQGKLENSSVPVKVVFPS